jgi:formylglycine-generating enzyme required for sulfatase activity
MAEGYSDRALDDRYLIYRHDIAFAWIPTRLGSGIGKSKDDSSANSKDNDGFYAGVYEVTQADWARVMGQSFEIFIKEKKATIGPRVPIFIGDKIPAYCLSYDDAAKFVIKLNELEARQQLGKYLHYSIPTEKEWVHAARAGCKNDFITGDYLLPGDAVYAAEISDIKEQENKLEWQRLSRIYPLSKAPLEVGTCSKKNEFGLYDIHGNVSELTSDVHRQIELTYPELKGKDVYITKGGAWCSTMSGCAFEISGWSGKDYNFSQELVGLRVIAHLGTNR